MKIKASSVEAVGVLLIAVGLLTAVPMLTRTTLAMQIRETRGSSDEISATVEINDGIEFIGAGAGETISITGVITATSTNGTISSMKLRLVDGAACEDGRITDSTRYLDRFAWLPYNKEIELPYMVRYGFQRIVAVVQLRDVQNEVSDMFCDIVDVEGSIPIEPTSRPSPTATPTLSAEIKPIVVFPLISKGVD